jgi:hypothetical protein
MEGLKERKGKARGEKGGGEGKRTLDPPMFQTDRRHWRCSESAPILEYNSIIWNPSPIFLIDLIEHVQRNFSKRIPSLSSLPYPERLALLDLEPLELRRLRFDLTYFFKVFNHLTPFNPSDMFLIYTPIASSRSNSPYLQRPTKASNKLLHTLFFRQVEAWNSLPLALKSASSLPIFKRGLKNIDLSKFLKGSFISL